MPDLHLVHATTTDGHRVRISPPLTWDEAQDVWRYLDDLRTAGRIPHVRHYVVRAVGDPAWPGPYDPRSRVHATPTTGRPHWTRELAAQAAYRDRGGPPGLGGWFRDPAAHGRLLAQGRHDLARVAKARAWIAELPDGRWARLDTDAEHPLTCAKRVSAAIAWR